MVRLATAIRRAWKQYKRQPWYMRFAPLFGFVVIVLIVSLTDRPVMFSYGAENCTSRPTILPDLFKTQSPDRFIVAYKDQSKVLGIPTASRLCVTAQKPPQQGVASVRASVLGLPFLLQKGMTVTVPAPTTVSVAPFKDGVATTKELVLPLSAKDTTYRYTLRANAKTVPCRAATASLRCDVMQLDLVQGQEYKFQLERSYGGKKLATIATIEAETLDPVELVKTTINPKENVTGKPTSLALGFNKPLRSATVVLERKQGQTYAPIATKNDIISSAINVSFGDLPRSSEYRLVITGLVADDGSALLEPRYELPFSLSGGPKVTGVNIKKNGVIPGSTIVVTFDQPIAQAQDVTPFIKLTGGVGPAVKQGNTLRFATNSVQPCADFAITVTKDLQNEAGIAGDSAWSISSRTLCQVAFSIGSTVQNRPITGYRFGNGAQKILFVGLTHGNEKSTHALLSQWVDELEAKARDIPADKTVYVIPALSRDGLMSGLRRNARNVDLNRNFPTNDWKADVKMPGGEFVKNGGGVAPLSEPESKAIASFTQSLSPRLVLTFHSTASLVTPNESGVSSIYAASYSRLSGYRLDPKSNAGSTFDYDTTGAYEDWLYEKLRIAAILVELNSSTQPNTAKNFPAMWAMLR